MDLGIILLLTPGWLLVGGLVAVCIKVGSTGPIFFRQERVGYRGRRFVCYKFRSMRVGAETESHRRHVEDLMRSQKPMIKLDAKRDPRLIPFGGLLRSSGLDELPQLLNVLRGEMSLVGPRPCIPYEYERYEPWHRRRFEAVPGLTGLWQVSGKNHTTFEEMIQLDINYAERLSPWLDLKIICKTLPALWKQFVESRAVRPSQGGRQAGSLEKPVQSYRL